MGFYKARYNHNQHLQHPKSEKTQLETWTQDYVRRFEAREREKSSMIGNDEVYE